MDIIEGNDNDKVSYGGQLIREFFDVVRYVEKTKHIDAIIVIILLVK